MDVDIQAKLAIYRAFAATGRPPRLEEIAGHLGTAQSDVREAYRRLAGSRLLVLEPDGHTIRMAPPPFRGPDAAQRAGGRGGVLRELRLGLVGALASITRLGPHSVSLRGVVPILAAGAVVARCTPGARRCRFRAMVAPGGDLMAAAEQSTGR